MDRTRWLILLVAMLAFFILPGQAMAVVRDQGQAYTACKDAVAKTMAAFPPAGSYPRIARDCDHEKGSVSGEGGYVCSVYATGPSTPRCIVDGVMTGTYRFDYSSLCESRRDYNGAFPSVYGAPISGSYWCNTGCNQVWTPNGDGTWNGSFRAGGVCNASDNGCGEFGAGWHYNAYLKVCEPDPPETCPAGKVKGSNGQCTDNSCPAGMVLQQDGTCAPASNECPQGQVKSPTGGCLPGDGQCAKGEVRGKDGTCKRDGDGDGQPDAGEEDGTAEPTFSGGDNCDSPPSCSGDVIMCGQARIQWRIDCNTRRNRNISGGTCDRVPICTGEKCDSLEYSSMLFQWRSACAAEKLLAKGTGSEGGNGEQPEWTKVGGMSQDPGQGASDGDTKVVTEKTVGVDDLDQGGFGGGSCIGFAVGGGTGVGGGFMQVLASPPALWCDYIGWMRAVIILIASVTSVFILSRGSS